MDFGIALAPDVDAWRVARRAQSLGFSHVWFYDTQMLCVDVFVAMALAAANTTRIRLGTGVVVPSNRIAPVTANALASLNTLAPGRIIFGVGTGFTARNTMGMGALRLAELREYVRVVQGLLAGETLEWECEGVRRKIRFLSPEAGLINIRDPIPLHISAFAPKARALTAAIADGWMTFASILPRAVHELEEMAAACRAVGRDPERLYKTVFTMGCILATGEDAGSPRARAQAGPLVPVVLHSLVERLADPATLPPALATALVEYRKLYETYEPADARYLQMHAGHLMWVRPEEARFVTADLLRLTTFTAPAEELRDRIRALRDAGCQQLTIQLARGHEGAIAELGAPASAHLVIEPPLA